MMRIFNSFSDICTDVENRRFTVGTVGSIMNISFPKDTDIPQQTEPPQSDESLLSLCNDVTTLLGILSSGIESLVESYYYMVNTEHRDDNKTVYMKDESDDDSDDDSDTDSDYYDYYNDYTALSEDDDIDDTDDDTPDKTADLSGSKTDLDDDASDTDDSIVDMVNNPDESTDDGEYDLFDDEDGEDDADDISQSLAANQPKIVETTKKNAEIASYLSAFREQMEVNGARIYPQLVSKIKQIRNKLIDEYTKVQEMYASGKLGSTESTITKYKVRYFEPINNVQRILLQTELAQPFFFGENAFTPVMPDKICDSRILGKTKKIITDLQKGLDNALKKSAAYDAAYAGFHK